MNGSDPAFPCENSWANALTKREVFAALAMQGYIAINGINTSDLLLAQYSVNTADALIAELSKGEWE